MNVGRARWAVAALTTLVLAVALASTTEGIAMADDVSLTAYETAQISLQPAVDAVYQYTETSVAAKSNLTDIGIDVNEMAVIVYWVGGVLDPETDSAFTEITQSTGTPINVVPTQFSRQEIYAAMDSIASSQPDVSSMSAENGEIIVKVGPNLTLSSRPSEIAVPGKGVAIPLQYEQSDVAPLATRKVDANPWTAGAQVLNGTTKCSSGFGVEFGSPADQYMLTAAHCALNGVTIKNGNGQTMGTTSGRNLAIDSILINVNSDSGYMYYGAWNDGAGPRAKVVGTHHLVLNNSICTSGSTTGSHCSLIVKSTTAEWKIGSTIVKGVIARPNSSTAVAAGAGDSGGPVFVNAGSQQVSAAGLISTGADMVACSGLGTSTCYNEVYIVPIENAQRGGTVVKG